MAEPTTAKLTSMHFYAWKKGLKTGMYYLRTRPKADAIQFTVDQTALANTKKVDAAAVALGKLNIEKTARNAFVDENQNTANVTSYAMKGLDSAPEAACETCSA